MSRGRESLGDELSQLKSMPVVELQVPVFVHMITRQSMLLVFGVVKMCQYPAWETERSGMVPWKGAADWQLSWEEQKHPRASSLLYSVLNMKLLRSLERTVWNST